MKSEKVSIVDRLREREKTLADTKMALSNLQNVLRDIGIDHEAQISKYEDTIAELKKNMEVYFFTELKTSSSNLFSLLKTEKKSAIDYISLINLIILHAFYIYYYEISL